MGRPPPGWHGPSWLLTLPCMWRPWDVGLHLRDRLYLGPPPAGYHQLVKDALPLPFSLPLSLLGMGRTNWPRTWISRP